MKTSLLKPVALAAMLAATGAANAAITVFTSSASFLAAVGATGTDTFAGFSITDITASPINRSAGAFGYTGSATNGFFGGGTTANPFLSTNTYSDPMVITPTSVIAGIGGDFFGSNISGLYAAGPVTVTATDSLGATIAQTISPSSATAGSFLGFVSDANIASLTIASATGQVAPFVWPSVDNLTLAAAIPEPGTYALMLGGLGLVGFLARRRRAD
jgi:hypothetical protein